MLRSPPPSPPRFGQAAAELLSDVLRSINSRNKENLERRSGLRGSFKHSRVSELIFLVCEELELDPLVGYEAIGLLDRFMVKHVENLLSNWRSDAGEGPCRATEPDEDLIFWSLSENFQILLLSSVQISSKLASHSNAIDNNSASRYLQSLGTSCSKAKLLESELLILKTLDFQLNVPNPLLYVETLLEVLAHNVPTAPVAQLHHLSSYVLQFIYLQRKPVYHSLLVAVTGCSTPSPEQREKFASVTEDCMLLGVGVISVSAYIYQESAWEKVVEELSLISGISARSIMDFAHVALKHISKTRAA